MAVIERPRAAGWFYALGVVLLLWGAAGVFAFYNDVTMNEARLAALPEWDRAFYAARPGWFVWAYGIATWAALAGSLMLLWGKAIAQPLYAVSLAAAVVQFGYVFLATDLIAAKGAGATIPFPLVILAIGAFQLWLAGYGRRRRWLL